MRLPPLLPGSHRLPALEHVVGSTSEAGGEILGELVARAGGILGELADSGRQLAVADIDVRRKLPGESRQRVDKRRIERPLLPEQRHPAPRERGQALAASRAPIPVQAPGSRRRRGVAASCRSASSSAASASW